MPPEEAQLLGYSELVLADSELEQINIYWFPQLPPAADLEEYAEVVAGLLLDDEEPAEFLEQAVS